MTYEMIREAYRAGRHQQVVDMVTPFKGAYNDHPREAYLLAASLFSLGLYEESFQCLSDIADSYRNNASFLSLYGAAHRHLGRLAEARKLLEKAVHLDPDTKEYQNNYANVLADLGEFKLARNLLQAILMKYPDYEDAQVNLSRVEIQLQRRIQPVTTSPLSTAPPDLSLAHQSDSMQSDFQCDPLELAFSRDEVKETTKRLSAGQGLSKGLVHQLRNLIPKRSKDDIAKDLLKLATALAAEESYEQALIFCSSSLRYSEALSADSYREASNIYLRSGRSQEAEICLLQYALLTGGTLSTYINLASFTAFRRDYKLALAYLDRAEGLDPSSPLVKQLREDYGSRSVTANKQDPAGFRFEQPWTWTKFDTHQPA